MRILTSQEEIENLMRVLITYPHLAKELVQRLREVFGID